MKIELFLPMDPPTCTHQEKKVTFINGKPVFYDPPEVKDARVKLIAHLVTKTKIERKMIGPVRLVTKWCFPACAGHQDGEYRTSKPDTDNLQKLLKDCMTSAGFWQDDAQVVSEITEKFWAKIPGIYIKAEELKPIKEENRK